MVARGRRRLIQGGLVGAGLLLAGCGVVSFPGQRPVVPRRIGFLESGANPTAFEAFREGLRELGYVEGQSIQIEFRDAELRQERLPTLAAELVGLPVELILASNGPAAIAASQATSTIPIVAAGGNVVGAGLVRNIARPEGNVTGVSTDSVEAIGKWIELLKETVPTISRLAVMLDPTSTTPFMEQVRRAAQALRLEAAPYELRELEQLSGVLARARSDRVDGLVVVSGGVLGGGAHPSIGAAVLKSRLPAVTETRPFAVNGGLLAHGPDTVALARRSASYVDKILKGAKPGDLPIELPTTFRIVLNQSTARTLGIRFPESVLARATEVLE